MKLLVMEMAIHADEDNQAQNQVNLTAALMHSTANGYIPPHQIQATGFNFMRALK
jgi:hypothetical protein